MGYSKNIVEILYRGQYCTNKAQKVVYFTGKITHFRTEMMMTLNCEGILGYGEYILAYLFLLHHLWHGH